MGKKTHLSDAYTTFSSSFSVGLRANMNWCNANGQVNRALFTEESLTVDFHFSSNTRSSSLYLEIDHSDPVGPVSHFTGIWSHRVIEVTWLLNSWELRLKVTVKKPSQLLYFCIVVSLLYSHFFSCTTDVIRISTLHYILEFMGIFAFQFPFIDLQPEQEFKVIIFLSWPAAVSPSYLGAISWKVLASLSFFFFWITLLTHLHLS